MHLSKRVVLNTISFVEQEIFYFCVECTSGGWGSIRNVLHMNSRFQFRLGKIFPVHFSGRLKHIGKVSVQRNIVPASQ